ncbi:hypothetical protein HNQ91_003104 [Filimonas zeae]|uniref:PA14 domain-containing protein n=1 Tax=Filimonas zeae TaxID=1737353 RepID=A0A917J212_9BACT|nr:hypothetical protein [Filimonas zeae]MDR6340039.1 hypothetical protein [Filimonas zeae]GGH70850.1 hypothetical protein GCM10011379_29550 [Filimonas zeae]
MIQLLALKYTRTVACFMAVLLYTSFVMPVYVAARTMDAAMRQSRYYAVYNPAPRATGNITAAPTPYYTVAAAPEETTAEKPREQAATSFIDGPSQPEMSSFKSVSTDNMVNLFTGDFSYNIPLMDVGGYPVNIFYDGSVGMEQDASWVGLGWNINPGNINRNTRGVPDDFNGEDTLIQEQNMKPNITWGASVGPNLEITGIKGAEALSISMGYSLGMTYNNYLGPSLELGLKAGLGFRLARLGEKSTGDSAGSLRLGMGVSGNISSRYGTTISPNISLSGSAFLKDRSATLGLTASTSYNSRSGIKDIQISEQMSVNRQVDKKYIKETSECTFKVINDHYSSTNAATLHSNNISFARPSYTPALRLPVTNENYAGRFQAGAGLLGIYGSTEWELYRQKAEVAPENRVMYKPMVGYLYYQQAVNNPNAVMDFTRLNDKEVTSTTPIISAPQYSYDVFSIQGEGTGGSIRAYRNDIGYVRDNLTTTKDKSLSIGVDIGIPGHFGANVNIVKTPSSIGEWNQGNKLKDVTRFSAPWEVGENVYFKNPAEKSVIRASQYEGIGNADLVRFAMAGSDRSPTIEPQLIRYSKEGVSLGVKNIKQADLSRKKRSQVISFLTAEEASVAGLDTAIKSYLPGIGNTLSGTLIPRVGGYRKKHHLSEIDVLEPDGKRYVYGIPAYNHMQKDFTFSVSDQSQGDTVLITEAGYMGIGSSLLNNTKKDGYVQTSQTPAHAHSFLLSGILSPDYTDITGDGISDDDLGTAVKFNYSCMMKAGKPVFHKWRTPLSATQQANYNRGLLSEDKDDKGLVSYGERESWYLHSIESKTMVAVFTLSNKRLDGKGAVSYLGGVDVNDTVTVQKLDRIDLYNKADLALNGSAAKAVKSVFFRYSQTLCAKTPNNPAGTGKLTLDSILFAYNGQTTVGNKDKYIFSYVNGSTGNPAYELNGTDRWGNYKPRSQNPQSLPNRDYPYSLQDTLLKSTIHNNAGAWALKKILLPSGGQIEVEYESDDYAFVQNRRAMDMMTIVGFGKDATAFSSRLYEVNGDGEVNENNFLFIRVPEACSGTTDVMAKYLDGVKQLAVKLLVKMPKREEMVPAYTTFSNYGVYSADSRIIWVQMNTVDGISPLSLAAVEFLREQLPGQAFPGYDVSEGTGLQQVGAMLTGMLSGLKNAFTNPLNTLRGDSKARYVTVEKSFVRLNDPDGVKYGGGNRVKAVRLKDNWQAMTRQYNTIYGQRYDYTTTEVVNGKTRTISSGVASYEPGQGSEENPLQTIAQVANRLPLGPASYGSVELPVLDAFFPAPSVGYSKVTVTSINNILDSNKNKLSRSGVGKQVTEFYTAKDYPVYYSHTALEPSADKQLHESSVLSFFHKYANDYRALSQGFLVATNDMHGQLKSKTSFAANDSTNPVHYTANYFKNTGEKGFAEQFDFVYGDSSALIRQGNMGIDVELMTDVREFSVKSNSFEVQAQVDLFPVILPIWLPFIWPVTGNSENTYRAVTTTKVVNYRCVLDSTVVIDKGSQASTKNLYYDAETGEVLVSRTNNEFDLPVFNTSVPAWWAYSGMGPAYRNVGAWQKGVNFLDGKITSATTIQNVMESGDELYVSDTGKLATNVCEMITPSGKLTRIWAFDRNKNNTSLTATPDLVFLDASGKPVTRNNVGVKIVRSGKRNLLSQSAATYATMKLPVVTSGNNAYLSVVGNDKVIAAGAVEFRERWQTDFETFKRYRTVVDNANCIIYEQPDCNGYIEKTVNPYTRGLLGNFVAARSKVFYGDRKSDAVTTDSTDITGYGFLQQFSPYWSFNSGKLLPDTASAKWVWNTEITRVNNKGAEIENRNALNIYTAALYGYNKSLPVAIANNARLHEVWYDGFEDATYSELLVPGVTVCKLNTRDANPRIVDSAGAGFSAHTGKKVKEVEPNNSSVQTFFLNADVAGTTPLAMGTANRLSLVNEGCNVTVLSKSHFSITAQATDNFPEIRVYCGGVPQQNTSNGWTKNYSYSVLATQYVNIQTKGSYTVQLSKNGKILRSMLSSLIIEDLEGIEQPGTLVTGSSSASGASYRYCLEKGIYKMSLNINGSYNFSCNNDGGVIRPECTDLVENDIFSMGFVNANVVNYKDLTTQSGCSALTAIAGSNDMINPQLNIPPGKKMLLSAWVKSSCANAQENCSYVDIRYDRVSLVKSIMPVGPVIDGWQKIEGDFTLPAGASSMDIALINNSANAVWFDDLRIHPYNSNMKSYVYDPVNLRLLAQLDENNYASFYEYDEEGTLIRTKAETERGIKTIQETRSSKQKSINSFQ